MSAWKEQLHDELDGLKLEEQIRILVETGFTEVEAKDLLKRQGVQHDSHARRQTTIH